AVIAAAITFLFYFASQNASDANASVDPITGAFTRTAVSPSATFPGANLGTVADGTSPCWNPGTSAARDVTFAVSGLTGSVNNVELSMTWGAPVHTFVGDITAVLIAPGGSPTHTLFGHTLATTATAFGDSSDLAGPYVFKDTAVPPSGGWWQAATAAGAAVAIASGDYRTTNSGGAGATNPMPATNMTSAFAGVANPNGTWTLRLTDSCAGDTGAISAASLTITAGAAVPVDANVDMNGDGKTDFVVARGTTTPLAESVGTGTVGKGRYAGLEERPARETRSDAEAVPAAPPIYWYTLTNGSGTTLVQQLGDAATDFITPEDFDGDGKDDVTVWTEAAGGVANFKIFQSSTNTLRVDVFGQTGDDPAVVGDYDGDNKADVAVYRCPPIASPDGQCFFFYRGSLNNPGGNITYVPWGFGVDGDFFPYVGDLDGDQKNDFCIQRANPASPSSGQFLLLRSSNSQVEYIDWGLSSDFLIPGDYDGDGKTDICVRRTVGGNRQHWVLLRTGSHMFQQWGVTGDSSVPGDYDGDGKTDFAVWRGNADPNQTNFWILNSSNSSVTVQRWGQCATIATCDFAVAGWAVH
ncbi:MAG TPA: VCBS repeat-containing protein, partial [Pyrinomonadaceae bacterium]